MTMKGKLLVGVALFFGGASPIALASPESYSPYAEQRYPTNVYFGDTHLHTNMSLDAYVQGNTSLTRDDAYRFAKGEKVTSPNGQPVRLGRPLDFLVIADHVENMGVLQAFARGDDTVVNTEAAKRWFEIQEQVNSELGKSLAEKGQQTYGAYRYWVWNAPIGDEQFRLSAWQQVASDADRHNQPGKFTALIGYEWTGIFFNLHRVVIFKDDARFTDSVMPYGQYDQYASFKKSDPEGLWAYLGDYQVKTGGEVLAIPHNSNMSAGGMFALEDAQGNPLSMAYAKTRSRWEPLLEVTQVKGDSETHPLLSPEDEFADYETWSFPKNDPQGWDVQRRKFKSDILRHWYDEKNRTAADASWQRPYEYARSALKLGLEQQAGLGVNPFKFGMVGSTDSHISLSAAEENNFFGKLAWGTPSPKRMMGNHFLNWNMNAAGFAAVWAEENTRAALFAAMKRRETYATTGPRMMVRFFGGWEYGKDDAFKPDLAKTGYAGGVPMGGDLTSAPWGKAPSFLIRAVKDPDGANLDRVQVVKGWRSADGVLHEKIYNVALSNGRKDKGNRTKPVGSTVNIKEASYTNTIGAAELATVWRDPDFNADELAFYYVRVLEIPTPRWTAYDAKYFGLKGIPDEVPMVTQERAYTSPIWYTP